MKTTNQILEMLAAGKITADEAERLLMRSKLTPLPALPNSPAEPPENWRSR